MAAAGGGGHGLSDELPAWPAHCAAIFHARHSEGLSPDLMAFLWGGRPRLQRVSRPAGAPHDPIRRGAQAIDARIGRVLGRAFAITAVDPDGAATRGGAGIDVAPAVADHETCGQIDRALSSSLEQHAGVGLAAIAAVRVIVITGSEEHTSELQSL